MSGSATEELGKLFAEYKEKKVEPVIEEVTEEVVLSEDEQNKFNLFSGLIQSLSETNEKSYPEELPSDVEPTPEDDPMDDVTGDVGDWIKKDIDKSDKKVEAFQELFAPLTDIPLTEPVEEEIVEEVVSPVEEEVFVEKKVEQPKKPRTIKKAMISVDEQKFMSSFLEDISKIPPEEKPVDVSEQSFPNSIKDSLLTPDQTSLQRQAAQPEDSLTRLRKEFEQFRTVMQRNLEAKQNAYDGNSGSGAVKIQDMDDVDTDTALLNGRVLQFNSTLGKFDGINRVTEAIIQEGTANDKIVLDGTDSDGTDAGHFLNLEDDSFGSGADLSNVVQDIIPDQNNVRNLGSSDKRFKELFLSGQTIDLGGATISSDGSGVVSISADGVTLPQGSKVVADTIATAGTNGKTSVDVEFFSRAGGTSTANATFKFQSKGLSYVFTDAGTFTLANGTALEDSNPELFSF
ncbi:hypothetical protein CMO86_06865 [Candidatus Woesearchaeota archaeon]|nr:hypothetical protein [Candidatus Woesearchaeota archaeon]